ncbi:DUF4856 domain-containing protein [Flavobacterium sp.]|uniref:DUF4856 domain-containing protein n=1 Tax=Flavobacterium sp. TaxID=239 RepID=UPI003D6A1720
MKFKNVLLAALPVLMLTFASCSDNNDEPQEEQITVLPYTVPATYDFSRNTTTSVAHDDQKTRILMLTEINGYITSGKDNPLTSTKLAQMYANTNAQFTTLSLVGIAPSINLKDKTATSIGCFNGGNTESTAVQGNFQSTFDVAVAASQTGATASAGVAGKNGTRLYGADGLEPGQVVAKGMMGAHFMDQVLNNFLNTVVLDAGDNRLNNANKVLVAGKNYTEMEHAWDQAYGYIYGAGLNASNKPYFWDSYIDQVSSQVTSFNVLKTNIKNAFIKGRAAITGNDYAVRDQQIAIIKENFSKIPAIRGVHYLQKGKADLANGITAFHGLSEGYGFIMSLRYTNNPATNQPYFTKAEVDVMLGKLSGGTVSQPGLWDVDHIGAKIDEISNQIATKFGFSVSDASQG